MIFLFVRQILNSSSHAHQIAARGFCSSLHNSSDLLFLPPCCYWWIMPERVIILLRVALLRYTGSRNNGHGQVLALQATLDAMIGQFPPGSEGTHHPDP